MRINPEQYSEDCPRFRVNKSAWCVVTALGKDHGYKLGSQPVQKTSLRNETVETVVMLLIKPPKSVK